MNKNLKVFLFIILFIIIGGGLFYLLGNLMVFSIYVQGVRSIILLPIFTIILYFSRKNLSENKIPTIYLIYLLAVIGMFFDVWGNFIYNKPLELLFTPFGKLTIIGSTSNYAPGEFATSYSLTLLTNSVTKTLPLIILYVYRFIQYTGLLLIVNALIGLLPMKEYLPPETEIKFDILEDSAQELVIQYIKSGEKIRAVKVVVDNSDYSLKTAKRYVDFLEKDLKNK